MRLPKANCPCEIKDLSLQAMNGVMQTPETITTVFDQAAVDLIDEKGDVLARPNSYVHAVSAVEPNSSSATLRVIVRFVDQDPAKMEVLSKLIG